MAYPVTTRMPAQVAMSYHFSFGRALAAPLSKKGLKYTTRITTHTLPTAVRVAWRRPYQ